MIKIHDDNAKWMLVLMKKFDDSLKMPIKLKLNKTEKRIRIKATSNEEKINKKESL